MAADWLLKHKWKREKMKTLNVMNHLQEAITRKDANVDYNF